MSGSKISSVVIVRNPRGYTATLRFTDPSLDECISADSHRVIYERIERIMYRLGEGF